VTRVPVHQPQLSVVLHKTVQRDHLANATPTSGRFRGSSTAIDLTPFLGEGSSVRTSKSVHEPAGSFTISVLDKAYTQSAITLESLQNQTSADSAETLYGLIEPMDFVEIRMRHVTDGADGDVIPIVMRGFVSSVDRVEEMGADGKPSRFVEIVGQDYGKLWQIMQIRYLPGYVTGEEIISSFKLFERFKAGLKTSTPAPEFVREMLDKILNPFVDGVMPADSTNPREITLDEEQLIQHGTTSLTGPQNDEGSIYDLMRRYLDCGIWTELFIEDREDGVFLVCRPNPFTAVDGELIQEDATELEPVEVPVADLVSIRVRRSDANLANYYWVRGPRFEPNTDIVRKQHSIVIDRDRTVVLSEYPNSALRLYGQRLMEVDTQMGGDDVDSFNSGQERAEHARRDTSIVNWINERRRILVEQNKDNVLFEEGGMRLRGNEALRAGQVMRLVRGRMEADYYIDAVSHDFRPFASYVTSVVVSRGRGFIERVQREGGPDSPYYAELSP
jgi:hypothetical protein